ncbi:hypothetical protein [Aurantiacibacter sediminis]|uniref:Uncharacterized protein n=1 Tax=Aurantiacibacter sediminis TaxID=2793064 RepID=A0ABS0N612_9SPHN|nr:hypothetical protein [Aurantiacibacter sediminis]MBH5323254.1 hypothetical protein [Aurantiacibacter sediminis]
MSDGAISNGSSEQPADDDVDNEAEGHAPASLSLRLVPQRLTLSATKLVLNWRLHLRNDGDVHIVGLRIWSDMTTARRSKLSAEEAGRPDMRRAHLRRSAMIAPGGEDECLGEWQMPRDDAHLVKYGSVRDVSKPRVLPLGRFRLVGAGIEPLYVAFAIGTAEADATMPEPLLFDDRMQIFANLVASQLA